MWMLDNRTPYEAERTWVRDKEGVHHWIVVVKATYEIGADGSLKLSSEPVPPLFAPEYHGEAGVSSLRFEADLVAMKPGTDIYLNAIAYAPQGRPQTELRVGLQVDKLRKELNVYGHRSWHRGFMGGLTPSDPEPFEMMPITYERAYGGCDQADPDPRKHRMDFRNPVGTGVAAEPERLAGKPAPNIENPGHGQGAGWPAGFGAIASYWSPRRELAGTFDEQWNRRRRPLLPSDYDPQCLLCSPVDQRPQGYLKGGECIRLTNLTESGWLQFTLPAVTFRFATYFGSVRKEHGSELVSVIFESAGPRVILVWQTSLQCADDPEYLDKTVIRCEPEN